MISIKIIYEISSAQENAHVSCMKYKNLNNISHYHSDYEIVYVNEGHASVSVNEKFFHLRSKECIFIHSNDIHHIHSDENTIITVLKAGNKYFSSIFASRRFSCPILNRNYDFESVLNAIGAELTERMENSGDMANSIAMQFFIKILRDNETVSYENDESGKSNTTAIYHEICRKISREYGTITFKDAAEYLHFSEPYFSKIFHSIFGMTFTQYLNTVRIAAAVDKIKHTNLSITEISAACGFNTIRNFNRVFKNFTGYSPNDLPSNYVFLYSLQDGKGLNPTLNCTEILEW